MKKSSILALELLNNKKIKVNDFIYSYHHLISDKTLKLFSVYCVRQVLTKVKNPDVRSVQTIDIVERYIHGRASNDELSSARDEASNAIRRVAESVDWSAGEYVVESVAEGVVWSLTDSVASGEAEGVARSAAMSATWVAENKKEWGHFREVLIKMVEEEVNEVYLNSSS